MMISLLANHSHWMYGLNYQIVSHSSCPSSWETNHFRVVRVQDRCSGRCEKENRKQLHIKEEKKSVMKTSRSSFLLFEPWVLTSKSTSLLVSSASFEAIPFAYLSNAKVSFLFSV